jgi:hypothetical protein
LLIIAKVYLDLIQPERESKKLKRGRREANPLEDLGLKALKSHMRMSVRLLKPDLIIPSFTG